MSKQQSKKQQKEEQVKFEKIMEMYHHGNQEMAKYLALQAMENYIKSLMKKQFSTYVAFDCRSGDCGAGGYLLHHH